MLVMLVCIECKHTAYLIPVHTRTTFGRFMLLFYFILFSLSSLLDYCLLLLQLLYVRIKFCGNSTPIPQVLEKRQ